MEDVFYEDSDYCEKVVDKAINNAIANLAMEGFAVTKEEKENLKKEFLDNYKIRILIKKKEKDKNGRMG
jgi:CRISPR/Cas system-associated endonuclease Cas3-HD